MKTYTIGHAYRSTRDGVTYGPWAGGESVELDADTAEWLERDSPGVLCSPEPEPERQAKPAPNRQQKPARNRGA